MGRWLDQQGGGKEPSITPPVSNIEPSPDRPTGRWLSQQGEKPTIAPVAPTAPQKPTGIISRAKKTISEADEYFGYSKFLSQARDTLEKEIGQFKLVAPAYAPAKERATQVLPTGEKVEAKPIEELSKEYLLSPLYEKNRKANVLVGSLFRDLTGGAIKPDMEIPETPSERTYAGIGSVMGSVTAISAIGTGVTSLLTKTGAIAAVIGKYPRFAKWAIPFIKTASTFDIYGQLDKDIENRFQELLKDTMMAVPFTIIGAIPEARYSIPASFSLGWGMSKLSGASNEDAFVNGAIFAVLDAAGRLKEEGNINKQVTDKIIKKESLDILSEYSGTKLNNKSTKAEIKSAYNKAVKKHHPDVGGKVEIFRTIATAYEFLTKKTIAPEFYEKEKGQEILPEGEKGLEVVKPVEPEAQLPAKPPAKPPVEPEAKPVAQVEVGGVKNVYWTDLTPQEQKKAVSLLVKETGDKEILGWTKGQIDKHMEEISFNWDRKTGKPIDFIPKKDDAHGGIDDTYGTVKEWGTRNQYVANNPFRKQLDAMKATKKFDMDILKEAERWELEQVLKDKPAFLSDNLSKEEIIKFARKNKLWFRRIKGSDGLLSDVVVGKDINRLNRTLTALSSGDQRELGLSLGYEDLLKKDVAQPLKAQGGLYNIPAIKDTLDKIAKLKRVKSFRGDEVGFPKQSEFAPLRKELSGKLPKDFPITQFSDDQIYRLAKGDMEIKSRFDFNMADSSKLPTISDMKVGLDILKEKPRVSPLKGKKLAKVVSIIDKPMRVPLDEVEVTHPVKGTNAFWYKDKRIKLTDEQKRIVLKEPSPLPSPIKKPVPPQARKGVKKPSRGVVGETQTKVSKEVDDFVKGLDKSYNEEGSITIPSLKKPDLTELNNFIKKLGTKEEQIGEDAFWQQQLFEAKRETNIRDITKDVQGRFAPEGVVNILSKIPYLDRDASIRLTRSLQRLNFVKEKARQQLLYKSASAIKGIENGKPVFGTKIQKVLDDGTIKEDWRYTPEEGKALWDKLTTKERTILRDYIAPIDKAKSLFSRELLKQRAGLESGVEGYIHKYYEDKSSDRFRKIFFKYRKAAPTKKRIRYVDPETGKVKELTGNVENFEKAVTKQMENVVNAGEYNKFIEIWQDLLTEPLTELNPLKKGWVEVRGTLKTGIPTDKPRIFKTEEGYGLAPQTRRQTPRAVKDMYMKVIEDTSEAHAISNGLKSVARYWKGNVLIHLGTAATNAISGGIQYGTKIVNDFYKDGMFGGNFKPFFSDVYALIDALNPSTVERLRPELIGAQVNIATQFGKPKNFVDKFIQVGLTPFGMVETYWKRVIADATLRGIGKKPKDILPEFETFKKVGKEVDIYGYNYSNIPEALEKWRGSFFGAAIYPYITYPYKYARFVERYTLGAVKEVFTGNRKDGFARLMTLASIMSIIYLWQHDKEEKAGEYVEEMRYPGEFDNTGRVKISETAEEEKYFRVVKYPWLNFFEVLQAGAEITAGNKEKGMKEISGIGQEFVSEGPLISATDLLLGKRDKFTTYKDSSVLWGEVMKSFIPAFRINEAISRLNDPEKTSQDTFEQAIERALLIKPTGEIRVGFQKKELQYNREEEFLKFAFGINIRSIDKKEYEEAKNQAIQNMVHRLDDESVKDRSRERAVEVLKIFGVDESEHRKYLRDRRERMRRSRR